MYVIDFNKEIVLFHDVKPREEKAHTQWTRSYCTAETTKPVEVRTGTGLDCCLFTTKYLTF
jgi:hypothetical protein